MSNIDWKPSARFGKPFLNLSDVDPDNKSPRYLRKKLGEEIGPGMYQKEEMQVFGRDDAGNLRTITPLSEHLERKHEVKERAWHKGVDLSPEPHNVPPPVSWPLIEKTMRQMVRRMCIAFSQPKDMWPMVMPFNPLEHKPVDENGQTYYTFNPPAGYRLAPQDNGHDWISQVVGRNIFGLIAEQHGLSSGVSI